MGSFRSADFLCGLVTHDNVMIALIDLPRLLPAQGGVDADPPVGESKLSVSARSN